MVLAANFGLLHIYLRLILVIQATVSIQYFYGADKVMHGIEYAILGLLLARSIFSSKPRFSNGFLIILTVALTTLYGISDEIHQAFVPGRNLNSWDVLADGLGGMFGVLCYSRAK